MAIVVQPLGYTYKIKIGDAAFYCKQLSYKMRSIIGAKYHRQQSGAEIQNVVGLLFEVLRHSIKKVEGFVNPDGTPFELKFENDVLTEDCLDQLFHVERVGDILQMCASSFINLRAPDKIVGTDGEPIEGVSIEKIEPDKKKP